MTRRIVYFSGTRADFGLMRRALSAIHEDADFSLAVVVTGMHLDTASGETWKEVEAAGLPIIKHIPVQHGIGEGYMGLAVAKIIEGAVEVLEAERPDMVLLLGDRGEMLAAAIAALHLRIPIVHIHGGERSGTIDESVRHAISKMASIHLVATEESKERLIRMGENEANIHCVGAPGLDGLEQERTLGRDALCKIRGVDPSGALALLLFHPVVQEARAAACQITAILRALEQNSINVVALRSNSDLGGISIDAVLQDWADSGRISLATHMPRAEFVSWLASVDLLIGNSSSGIIEAATFGTPVVNVGSRQNLRQRGRNVYDVAPDETEIAATVERALERGRFDPVNVYGDGASAARIIETLRAVELNSSLLAKVNAY